MRGRLPAARNEVLISDGLANQLGIGPGATATLISSTMYGSMSTTNFTIAGTVNFGVRAMDRGTMIADIADLQTGLDMEDSAGEILGLFPDSLYRRAEADAVATAFNARWTKGDDEFAPTALTMHDQPGVSELMDYIDVVTGAIIAIFTIVMSIVLWNAGLIGGLRRYGEIGLRLAFGEDKGRLYRAMIIEAVVIGLFGSIVGTILALLPAYWLQVHGWDLGYLFAELVADAQQRHPHRDYTCRLRHRIRPRAARQRHRDRDCRHRHLQASDRDIDEGVGGMKAADPVDRLPGSRRRRRANAAVRRHRRIRFFRRSTRTRPPAAGSPSTR